MKNTSFRRLLARNLHTLAFWIDPKAKKFYTSKKKIVSGEGVTISKPINGLFHHVKMNLNPITPPSNVENQGNPVPASIEQTDGKKDESGVAVDEAQRQESIQQA